MFVRTLLLSVLATLALALTAAAAEFRGVLSKVDVDNNEIMLEGRGRGARGLSLTFTVEKDTRILFGQEPGKLADLEPGKRVHVFFEMRGNRSVAVLIEAHGQPSATVASASKVDAGALTGTLQRVAFTEREIVVVGNGASGSETETTLAVPDDVKVRRGDKALTFEDLKEGERVAVTTAKRDGKMTALVIDVGGTAAPPQPRKGERLQKVLSVVGQILQQVQQQRADHP